MTVRAEVIFTLVGYRVDPDAVPDEGEKHVTATAAEGEVIDLPDAEYQRLSELGAVIAADESDAPAPAAEPVEDPEPPQTDEDIRDYAVGGGYYEIDGERYRGRESAQAALAAKADAADEEE